MAYAESGNFSAGILDPLQVHSAMYSSNLPEESGRQRSVCDRILKYIVDPRRISHKYLLQILLCLFLSGPTFFDNFFNACVTDIISRLDISHEKFSLLISIPSMTGILCGAVAGIVSTYGSTLTAALTATLSYIGAIIVCYGISESSFSTIMTGRLVFVLFWNLLGSVQKVIIFRQFSGQSLAWIFGIKIVAIRLGAVSGLYFAGDIINQVDGSLPAALYFALALSGISLICTVAFAYLRRGTSAAREILPLMVGHRRRMDTASVTPQASSKMSILSIPKNAWICCLIIFLYYGGLTPFETFGVDYLVTDYGMSRADAGKALAFLPCFSFFSPLVSPLIASIRNQIIAVVMAQLLVAIAIFAQIVQLPYAPVLYICMMGIGHLIAANAVWLALASVSPSETDKTNAASVSSALYAFSAFSFNWVTGIIRDIAGDYNSALFMMSLLILGGAAVSMYLLQSGSWAEPVIRNDIDRILLNDDPANIMDYSRVRIVKGSPVVVANHFVPSN
jgi:hypothetical protein